MNHLLPADGGGAGLWTLTLRRSWRAFRASWARWSAIMVLLFAGMAVVVGLVSSSMTTIAGIAAGAERGNLSDGVFTTRAVLDEAQLDQLGETGARIEYQPYADVVGQSAGREVQVRVLGNERTMNRAVLDVGRMPRTDQEAVLEKGHARMRGVTVGDTVTVAGRGLRITGLGSFPDYALASSHVGSTADPDIFALLMVSQHTFSAVAAEDPSGPVPSYGYELGPHTSHEEVRDALGELTVRYGQSTNPHVDRALDVARDAGLAAQFPMLDMFLPAENNPRVTSAVGDSTSVLSITLTASVLVLILVAYVLTEFSRDRMLRESTVIGAWAAMGMSRRELTAHYLMLPLAITSIGAVGGSLLGPVIAPGLDMIGGYYSFPDIGSPVHPGVVAVGIGLPVGVVLVVTSWLLGRAVQVPVHELLRPRAPQGRGVAIGLHRFGFVTMFRIRQAMRSWASYLLIGGGVFLSIMLLVFGLGMRSSLETYLSGAEEDLSFSRFYTLAFPDLSAVPEGAEPAVAVPLDYFDQGQAGQQVTVLGLSDHQQYFQVDVAGLGPHEVVLSRGAAHKYGVHAGDTVVLTDRQLGTWAFRVVDIADYGAGSFAFTRTEHATALLDPALTLTAAWASSQADPGTGGASSGAAPPDTVAYYNALFTDATLDIDPDRLVADTTREEMLAGVAVFNALLSRVVNLVSGLAMMILVIVLYVLVRMVVARQRYAISLLKALGYSPREVDRLYLDNYFWLVVGVLSVSVPVSTWLMGKVWGALTADTAVGIPFVLSAADVVVVVLLTLGAYALVRVVTTMDTRAVSVVEILKLRE